jgi:hypothetical protein
MAKKAKNLKVTIRRKVKKATVKKTKKAKKGKRRGRKAKAKAQETLAPVVKVKRAYHRRKPLAKKITANVEMSPSQPNNAPEPVTQIEARVDVLANVPARMKLLNEAAAVTGIDRNIMYGDPLENFEAIVSLKEAFWRAVTHIADVKGEYPKFYQNTPMGHAIDMILMNLGRIASAPSLESSIAKDRYLDAAAYTAIAYEVSQQTLVPKNAEGQARLEKV